MQQLTYIGKIRELVSKLYHRRYIMYINHGFCRLLKCTHKRSQWMFHVYLVFTSSSGIIENHNKKQMFLEYAQWIGMPYICWQSIPQVQDLIKECSSEWYFTSSVPLVPTVMEQTKLTCKYTLKSNKPFKHLRNETRSAKSRP